MRKYKEFRVSQELFLNSILGILPEMESPKVVDVAYDPRLGGVTLLLESESFDDVYELEIPERVTINR